ncbi:hypothetical protein QE441_002326 [Chryseobacterium sp. SORGH_AS909]|uniref:Uncharacterized protein n=1 Tax=Chryseobacterium camelliae TaxID=1265445 RepID=A0ABU0TDT8_9FLAO|nr:hypothetical protein [Chryseobacterium camelliae]MDQ1099183.1 hypothetical protein [Chryseobacterium sp. SORGH_AS_1048]MDR6086532.1 hypothetical protein [Chryseobacterium sp. SORGH_AS_0909]MDR6130903.1 hypothetical protein [Chryseobacterium sp. SORGH_AS_1175]MDT3406962.1 hypothetical protein [Pseudacidovorax intermedius]
MIINFLIKYLRAFLPKEYFWQIPIDGKPVYIYDIIINNQLEGRSKSDIIKLFEKNSISFVSENRWKYFVNTHKKKEYVLIMHFKNDSLSKINYKYKKLSS